MARLWAMTVAFQTIAVGDHLPVLVKWETEHTILRFAGPEDTGESGPPDTLPPAALTAYVAELLAKAFPEDRLSAEGSNFELMSLQPVRLGDTTATSGRVVDKREENGRRLVDCDILIEVDGGETAATAHAVVVF